ncbi:glycosyltransferase involved in cell wall biosynthesis [Granulicella aggregans]|uniref:Glycosyltransferase involved in cell wall biosynthesis n=1 Tax=Granulicella aggregans TaxID=474949 RepID=A0A7W7ZAY5_9BACT|nr:glycosyltransferase family 4 protein [Granulicella aggregans]MBB5056556.1 glycosyltransferase involved in cell wall biosynthesis [Granulicella aggregans]
MTSSANSLRITFLLPMSAAKPAGGFKVVYEYANFLVARGHQVKVIHPNLLRIDEPLSSLGLKAKIKAVMRYFKMKWTNGYRPDHWFTVSPAVGMPWTKDLSAANVPDADIVVATAWETVEWAITYPPGKGRRFYIIQHLETWSGPEERVFDTWKAPFEKIVIAGWLQRIATEMGLTSHLIPNGMDFTRFRQTVPSEDRDPHQLLMLYHIVEWKGSADGLAAFEIARQTIPELRLTLFGIDPAPPKLPPGVEYHHQPPQDMLNSFYNRAAVFISPSWTEGWGLPPAEALMCGGAIAVTRGGADEAFAIDNETALVSPIKDPAALAANIIRLVLDRELRLRLAKQGHELIQQFTWERSGIALEALMLDAVAPMAEHANAEIETTV